MFLSCFRVFFVFLPSSMFFSFELFLCFHLSLVMFQFDWKFAPCNRPARITERRGTKRQSIYIVEYVFFLYLLNSIDFLLYSCHFPWFNESRDSNSVVDDAELKNRPQDPVVQSTMPKTSIILSTSANQQYTPKGKPRPMLANLDSFSSCSDSGFYAESDDLTVFFKNMEQTARKFDGLLQVKIKRMISDIIYDAEEQWLNRQM